MGQGLYTKVAQIVAHEFQIDAALVKITATTTGKVPNTSATAASSGTDLNGMAAMRAARTIKGRIAAFLADEYQTDQANVIFANGQVHVGADAMNLPRLLNVLIWGAYHYRQLAFMPHRN